MTESRVIMLIRPKRLDVGYHSLHTGDMADPWTTVDSLGKALQFLRMNGLLYSCCEFSEPWGMELPPIGDCLMFHVVISGHCWLDVEGTDLTPLHHGDLALVPHGQGHRLLSEPGAPAPHLFDVPREEVSEHFEIIRHGGGGAATRMVCGVVRFDDPTAQQLVKLLPKVIRVEASNSPEMEWIQTTLRLMSAEARENPARRRNYNHPPGRHPSDPGDPVVDRAGPGGASRLARRTAGQADRPRHLAHPSRARPVVDGGFPRGRGRDVAIGVCGALHGAGGRAGNAIRDALANARSADVAQGGRGAPGRSGGPSRLPVRGRVQPGLQALHRHLAGRGQA